VKEQITADVFLEVTQSDVYIAVAGSCFEGVAVLEDWNTNVLNTKCSTKMDFCTYEPPEKSCCPAHSCAGEQGS